MKIPLEACRQLSPLQVLEAPLSACLKVSREVFCFLGTWIQDIVQRLLRFVQPSVYPPLLFFHMDTNSTARGHLVCIKHAYMALGTRGRGIGSQVAFSFFLLTRENCLRRTAWILWINNQLQSWCQQQLFRFKKLRTLFEDQDLLGRDRIHLTM